MYGADSRSQFNTNTKVDWGIFFGSDGGFNCAQSILDEYTYIAILDEL